MKAMVLRAVGELSLEDVPSPAVNRASSHERALVRVTHSGICGTDLKIFNGSIPVRYPLIMGHEMAGVVVEGGIEGGGGVRSGDRVVVDPILFCGKCFHCEAGRSHLCPQGVLIGRDADGGFAEYVTAPLSHIFRLPDSIDNRTASLIQVLTTCLHAVGLADILPGQSVAVLGLGVTGQLLVQLAKAQGAAPVIGITRSAWKREMAARLGADVTLPAGDESISGVLQATDARGADLVIETTGTIEGIADGISMARLGATLLLFGITTAAEGKLPFYQLYFKELSLISSRAARNEDYPASIDLVERGVVQLKPLVSHVMPLAELGTAIGMLQSGADQRMKIVLENA